MTDLIYFKGKIIDRENANVNIMSSTAQFGLNVFEGVRAYWNEENKKLFIFKLNEHIDRLFESAKLIGLELSYTKKELKNIVIDTLKANDYTEDVAFRIIAFADEISSWSYTGKAEICVAPIKKGRLNDDNLRCKISSWRRIDENSLSPRIKCGANYINSRMAQLEAKKSGYDMAIFLDKEGFVSESVGSCIFMKRGNQILTPSTDSSILNSITRNFLINFIKDNYNDFMVNEKRVNRTELYTADEIFLVGTSVEIIKISNIDGFNLKEDSFIEKLKQDFFDIVRGKNKKYLDNLTEV